MNQTSFSGEIEKVTIPTSAGEITILPGHQALTSIVISGMVSITPAQIPDSGYIIDQGKIKISIGQGILQIINDHITILTSLCVTSTEQSVEILSAMQATMQGELAKIKQEGTAEDLEKALIEMEKIGAELRIAKIGGISY